MIRVAEIIKRHDGPSDDAVTLDYEDRHRRRMALAGASGLEFLLDLAEVPDLRDGDALRLENGQVIAVKAAAEPLMELHAHDALQLTRIAWHIGNRHLAAEIIDGALIVRADHVIAAMVEGLGGHVHAITAPFNPERGAYAGAAATHGHRHHHGPGDDHHG